MFFERLLERSSAIEKGDSELLDLYVLHGKMVFYVMDHNLVNFSPELKSKLKAKIITYLNQKFIQI